MRAPEYSSIVTDAISGGASEVTMIGTSDSRAVRASISERNGVSAITPSTWADRSWSTAARMPAAVGSRRITKLTVWPASAAAASMP